MKYLITTIAAVVLVGCGPSVPEGIDINVAASTGDIEAVKQYLADGGDVNAKDEVSNPLYWAAQVGQKEIVELLIANGADVNLRSGMVVETEDGSVGEQAAQSIINSKTPLDMALDDDIEIGKKLRKLIVDLLRKHGAKTGEELKAEGK